MNSSQGSPRIHIGKVLRDARVFNPKHQIGAAMNSDSLLEDVARWLDLLEEHQVSYVLVGGVAMLQSGSD